MDFLSGLVRDMIKESTGYDVRKVSRLVGGKKGRKRRKKGRKRKRRGGGGGLLAFGAGAALGGGVATILQQQQKGSGTSSGGGLADWDAPRGPAAPPSAAPPVPPPPRPAGAPPDLPAPPATAAPSAVVHPIGSSDAQQLPASSDPFDAPEEAELEVSPDLTFAIVRSMIAAALADGHLDGREKTVILARLEESGLPIEQRQQIHRDLVLPPTPAELAALSADPDDRETLYRFAGLLILADGNVAELERSFLDRLAAALGFDEPRQAELEAEIFA